MEGFKTCADVAKAEAEGAVVPSLSNVVAAARQVRAEFA